MRSFNRWLYVINNTSRNPTIGVTKRQSCHNMTMSRSTERPPIGAFVITPLQSPTHTKDDSRSTSGSDAVIVKHSDSGINKLTGNTAKPENKADASGECKSTVLPNGDQDPTETSDFKISGSVSGTGDKKSNSIETHRCDSDFVEASESSIYSSKTSVQSSSGTSLMIKLSGASKCRLEQKKTVLPASLLQSVTELVKTQQVRLDNYGLHLSPIQKDSGSSGRSDREADLNDQIESGSKDNKPQSVLKVFESLSSEHIETTAECRESKAQFDKLAARVIDDAHDQLETNEDCIKTVVLEHDSAANSNESCSASAQEEEVIKETGLNVKNDGSASSVERSVCEHDSFEDKNGTESSPFIDMDVDSITDCCDKTSEAPEDSFNQVVDELLHIDKGIFSGTPKKQMDVVYNLSDLFSGELEKKRKRELRKWKQKQKKLAKFSKQKKKKSSGSDKDDNEDGADEVKEKTPKRLVPNYFVAIQIHDKLIKDALQKVQDKIVSENKQLTAALIKISTLHLTMCVLSLNSEEEISKSKLALEKASVKLLETYKENPLSLDISGLGHFRNEVVFAKVKKDDQVSSLKLIAETVEDCFVDYDIVPPDKRGFKPHVTIMKLSKVRGAKKKKGLKKIKEELYTDFLLSDFGCETADSLQLCSMMKAKDEHGYYHVEHTVQFADFPLQSSETSSGDQNSVNGVAGIELLCKQAKDHNQNTDLSDKRNDSGIYQDITSDTGSAAEDVLDETARSCDESEQNSIFEQTQDHSQDISLSDQSIESGIYRDQHVSSDTGSDAKNVLDETSGSCDKGEHNILSEHVQDCNENLGLSDQSSNSGNDRDISSDTGDAAANKVNSACFGKNQQTESEVNIGKNG